MRTRILFVVLLVCTEVALTRPTDAAFLGVFFENHAIVQTPSGPLRVIRMYARFSQGDDRVLAWGASPDHPTRVGTTCASPFFNPSDGSNRAPTEAMIAKNPMVQWDTFATIGVSIAEQGPGGVDQTNFLFDWPPFIEGSHVEFDNAIVTVSGPLQGRADYAGDGDLQLRVLLAQFSVSGDEGLINAPLFPLPQIGFVTTTTGTITDIGMTYATPVGRCCLGSGGCIVTDHQSCLFNPNSGNRYVGCQPCTVCNRCYADLAPPGGDGAVNVTDLLRVIEQWGNCTNCAGDIAQPGLPIGDGVVNVTDLLAVINNWGTCE